jgi:acetoin utilization protein AcuB
MDHIPSIKSVMTPFPYSIDAKEEISSARDMMTEHDIRHLPVVEDGAFAGIVSVNDLRRRTSVDDEKVPTIADLRLAGPYIVSLSEPVDRVLREMVARHLEAALVVKGDKLAGIFTVTDALTAFADFLCSIFPPRKPEDAA